MEEELKNIITRAFDFDNNLGKIEEKAKLVDLDFQNFRIDFRGNTKFAQIDEFHRNQIQNKAQGLYF